MTYYASMLLTNYVKFPFSKCIHSLSRLYLGSGGCTSEQHELGRTVRTHRCQQAIKLESLVWFFVFFLIVLDLFILFSVYECFCPNACVCTTCVLVACRSQKRMPDPLKLEIWMVLKNQVGCQELNLGPFGKTSAFKH